MNTGKRLFFASDFHLGAPNADKSRRRELDIIDWLEQIRPEAAAIVLVGDIFDFWYEYRHVIPKGFVRFQGKLAELSDAGIPIAFFTGNHDMWMQRYFWEELGIPVYRQPQSLHIANQKLYIGHGDGLGPGDYTYKLLKRVFENRLARWLFSRLVHPDWGVGLALFWSRSSRARNQKKGEEQFMGEKEWLWQYCRSLEQTNPHDWYIFGHRHLPLDLPVGTQSRYINLGEWLHHYTYASYDGQQVHLQTFEPVSVAS